MNELGGGLVCLKDLDLTWAFDLDVALEERAQQAPAACKAGDGNLETMGSSQGGVLEGSSAPAGRAKSDPGEASASDTDQGNCEDQLPVLSGRKALELSDGRRLPATVRGWTRGQSQRLEGEPVENQPRVRLEVGDALCGSVRVDEV